jgi:hypothetical protein
MCIMPPSPLLRTSARRAGGPDAPDAPDALNLRLGRVVEQQPRSHGFSSDGVHTRCSSLPKRLS